MATQLTKTVLTELRDILHASSLSPIATVSSLMSTAEATADIYADVSLETVLFSINQSTNGRDGYLRTFLINVHVLADCKDDKLRIYDVVDVLESSILNDNALWTVVINRDIASINYDHGETIPYRAATILVEATIRLDCNN